MKRLLVVLLVFAVTVLMGYGGPSSSWAESDETLRTGIDAYVWAYPLVLMDVTRLYTEMTARVSDNVFFRGRFLSHADPSGAATADDNALVTAAWLDLSKEPVIMHMPDFGSRRYTAQLTDGWTNVFHALGTATAGNEAHDFAVVGPYWKGDVPFGMTVIHSPTSMALVFVRVLSSRTVEDLVAVYALQDRMSLTPLSSYGRPNHPPIVRAPPVVTASRPPSKQVADMDAKTFFTYFARLLISNPPTAADVAMMTKLASAGVVRGPDFDFDKLDPAFRDTLSRSIRPAQTSMQSIEPVPGASYLPKARSAFILGSSLPADPRTSGPTDQPESQDTISVENGILFKSEGRRSNEPGFDIREDIERGQEFLRDKIAGYSQILEESKVTFSDKKGRRQERLIPKRIVRPSFLLAVEDLKERKIRQVLITSRGCVTEGFHVKRTQDNGVASRFEVTYPENMAILALRTTVRSGVTGIKEVVYTPYSPEIDTKAVRKAGLDYLTGRIEFARNDLAAKKVRLAEFDMDDGTPMEVSLVLSIIEHIDPVRFEQYKGNEIALVHEVLTIIGANTTEAYRYSRSSAGARGLFQLLPGTYRRLQERIPERRAR